MKRKFGVATGAALLVAAAFGSVAVAQFQIQTLGTVVFNGLATFGAHVATNSGTPVLSSCGTSPAIAGTDTNGTVTMGTGTPTGCVITFAAAYTTAPHCVVTWEATPLASQSYAISTTAITLTQTATSSNKADYWCAAPSGG